MGTIGIYKIEMKDNDILPFPPSVRMELVRYTSEKDRVFLSPECFRDAEIDYYADRLIKQIETARIKAKRHLAKGRDGTERRSKQTSA